MRIAVKSAGGITECFLHADNAEEGAKDAAKQIADDYGLPTDIELWSDPRTDRPAGWPNSASSPSTAKAPSSTSTEPRGNGSPSNLAPGSRPASRSTPYGAALTRRP